MIIKNRAEQGKAVSSETLCVQVRPGEDFFTKAHGKALRAFQQPIMICLASACKQWQAKVVSECGEQTRRTHVKKKKKRNRQEEAMCGKG